MDVILDLFFCSFNVHFSVYFPAWKLCLEHGKNRHMKAALSISKTYQKCQSLK